MSTYYCKDSEVESKIKSIYGEKETLLRIALVDIDYKPELVAKTDSVIISEKFAYIVVKVEDELIDYDIYMMSKSEFIKDWSEEVWAKFRADFNDTVCPHCHEQNAHMVARKSTGDRLLTQFFCDECGYGWVGHPNGEFIREGVLKSDWEMY